MVLARLGRLEEACDEARQYQVVNPHFSISHFIERQPFRDLALRDLLVERSSQGWLSEVNWSGFWA